jgi:hypothetical protein
LNHGIDTWKVATRNNKHVERSLRVDISKGNNLVILIQILCFDITPRDRTKDTGNTLRVAINGILKQNGPPPSLRSTAEIATEK